jgi:hypothetical protein
MGIVMQHFVLYCTHCGSSWYPHVTYDTCALLPGAPDLNPWRSKRGVNLPLLSGLFRGLLPAQFFVVPCAISNLYKRRVCRPSMPYMPKVDALQLQSVVDAEYLTQ